MVPMKIFQPKKKHVKEIEEKRLKSSFVILLLTKYDLENKIKKNETGGTRGNSEREDRSIEGLKGHLRDRHYLEEVGVDGSLILKRVLKK
jgi:hypothetical protein